VISDGGGRYVLRLYVTGSTGRSLRAIDNITRIANAHLANNHDLTIIDIYVEPEAARDDQIIAAPTLLRVAPLPRRRILGDLSDEARVLSGLEIDTDAAS